MKRLCENSNLEDSKLLNHEHLGKRLCMSLVTADYARYELNKGIAYMAKEGSAVPKDAVAICKGWPSWAFAASAIGLEFKAVVLGETHWMNLYQKWFPDALVLGLPEALKDRRGLPPAAVCCTDLEPLASLQVWSRTSELIITPRPARRIPHSWTAWSVEVAHLHSGGVTDGRWRLNTYFPSGCVEVRTAEGRPSGKRDLSSVLSATVSQGWPSTAPKTITGSDPKVVYLRPKTIHPQGLLSFLDREVFVVTQNVFSNTGWCRRRLTPDELLNALDVPGNVGDQLHEKDKRLLFQDRSFVPLKTAVASLYAALNWDAAPASKPNRANPTADSISAERGPAKLAAVGPVTRGVLDDRTVEVRASGGASANMRATEPDGTEASGQLWDDRDI